MEVRSGLLLMKDKDDESKRTKVGLLKILVALGIIGLLWLGLSMVEPTKEPNKLENNVLQAVNSSLLIQSQSYGVMFFDLEPEPLPSKYESIADEIIMCESGGDNNAIGDHGLARGVAQFHLNTFNLFKEMSGMVNLSYYSAKDQRKLLLWALDNNLESHWTCYKKLYGSAI